MQYPKNLIHENVCTKMVMDKLVQFEAFILGSNDPLQQGKHDNVNSAILF